MATPEREPDLVVDELVDQLRNAEVDTSARAVLVLAIHANRRQLSRDQVVQILARFTLRRWSVDIRLAADRLLEDIGAPAGPGPVAGLELDVAEASGDVAHYLWLLPSAAGQRRGEPEPAAHERLVADLEAALGQYQTAVPVAHLRLILQRYRERGAS